MINFDFLDLLIDFDDFKVDNFDLLMDSFDLSNNICLNLIKNRLTLIKKRSKRFDTIPFRHQISESDRNGRSNWDNLESESSMIRFRSHNSLSRVDIHQALLEFGECHPSVLNIFQLMLVSFYRL